MGCETNIRLKGVREEKSQKMKNPFKNNSESKREHVFNLFALPEMKVQPARDCIKQTEKGSSRKKCIRKIPDNYCCRNTALTACFVLHRQKKPIIKGVTYHSALGC